MATLILSLHSLVAPIAGLLQSQFRRLSANLTYWILTQMNCSSLNGLLWTLGSIHNACKEASRLPMRNETSGILMGLLQTRRSCTPILNIQKGTYAY